MRALNFTVIKITIYTVFGILIGFFFNISSEIAIIFSALCFMLLFVVFFKLKPNKKKSFFYGVIVVFTFICLGLTTTVFHNQKNHHTHYSHLLKQESDSTLNIVFRIRNVLKPSKYYNKYEVDLTSINNTSVTGKVLLNIKKDTINTPLKVDDLAFINTKLKTLPEPLNPYQFNYKSYLNKKYIYNQITAKHNQVLILNKKKQTIFGYASKVRDLINQKLNNYHFEPDELAIIKALLLGQRQDVSEDVYNNYTQAGAIHILAVSGLHVGIILLILTFILKPLEHFKYGKTIKLTLILIALWCFAIVAGLSASVTRAVTMFSFVTVGLNLNRPTNIYNTLAISAFVLLLIKPMFLFDVGFQLSYLAVSSIVWIQPILYKFWKPRLFIVDKLWQIFTVTLAAQLGIMPVSLFYFHQFPGLFFISNLVIIPVLGLILGLGLLVITLALLNVLPPFLAEIFGFIIKLMNGFVAFISKQESFLFKDVPFSILLVLCSYFLIISIVKFYQNKTYKTVISFLISIAIFISAFIFNNYRISSNQFIVFHKTAQTIIGIKHNQSLTLYQNLDSLNIENHYLITNYKTGNWINKIKLDSVKSVYKIDNKLILVIDSLGIYKTSFKPNYIILTNSPKINLNRLIETIQPDLIIADGSNYKSFQNRWKETCKKQKLPLHLTSEKGAFMINFDN